MHAYTHRCPRRSCFNWRACAAPRASSCWRCAPTGSWATCGCGARGEGGGGQGYCGGIGGCAIKRFVVWGVKPHRREAPPLPSPCFRERGRGTAVPRPLTQHPRSGGQRARHRSALRGGASCPQHKSPVSRPLARLPVRPSQRPCTPAPILPSHPSPQKASLPEHTVIESKPDSQVSARWQSAAQPGGPARSKQRRRRRRRGWRERCRRRQRRWRRRWERPQRAHPARPALRAAAARQGSPRRRRSLPPPPALAPSHACDPRTAWPHLSLRSRPPLRTQSRPCAEPGHLP